jgi:hypothetical protein
MFLGKFKKLLVLVVLATLPVSSYTSVPSYKDVRLEGFVGMDMYVDLFYSLYMNRPGKDIRLTISSHGGLIASALDIMTLMRAYKKKIICNIEVADSAAAAIALACDELWFKKGSTLRFHAAHPSSEFSDTWDIYMAYLLSMELGLTYAQLGLSIKEYKDLTNRNPYNWKSLTVEEIKSLKRFRGFYN